MLPYSRVSGGVRAGEAAAFDQLRSAGAVRLMRYERVDSSSPNPARSHQAFIAPAERAPDELRTPRPSIRK